MINVSQLLFESSYKCNYEFIKRNTEFIKSRKATNQKQLNCFDI